MRVRESSGASGTVPGAVATGRLRRRRFRWRPVATAPGTVPLDDTYTHLTLNKRACRFRQALLFELGVVARRSLFRLHDHEGAASIETTNAQQNFLLVGLLHRRVEFTDAGDGLFRHRFNHVAGP